MRWVMKQEWCDLLFMHWAIDPDELAPLIPEALELETYDGKAWLGVVPFRMQGIRLRWLPPVPGTSAFPELNVRTYVRPRGGGKPGVYFFSLEAANRLAVWTARRWFHLPYFRATMKCARDGDVVSYESTRTHPGANPARFVGTYGPTGPVAPAKEGSLDHFLTERYCLYAIDAEGGAWQGDVEHEPWQLQPAQAEVTVNTMSPIALPDEAPVLHFASCIDVNIGRLKRI